MYNVDHEKADAMHDAFLKRIERIKAGEEFIITDSGTNIGPQDAAAAVWSSTENYHPTHSMLDAANPYTMVDSAMLDAEEDKRR